MKFKKSIISLMLTIGLFASAMPISAQISDSEISEITNAMKEYDSSFDTELSDENVYKSYSLDGLYKENYYNSESFESLIYGEVRTYVETEGSLITLLERDGKLEAVGETLQLGAKGVTELKLESEKISESIHEEIADIKFCHFSMLKLAVIYYKTTNGNEFVVPYIDNAYGEYSGIIENGNLYSATEFLNQMKEVFNISGYNPNTNIGILDTNIIGDVNCDYYVNIRDAASISRMLANGSELPDTADYNKDGEKNVRDAAAIAIYVSKWKDG